MNNPLWNEVNMVSSLIRWTWPSLVDSSLARKNPLLGSKAHGLHHPFIPLANDSKKVF